MNLPKPSDLAQHWQLDCDVVQLNHGSYGACPKSVLDLQTTLRARLEANTMKFINRELQDLVDEARGALATFLGANPRCLAFVPNATYGVNSVLRSLKFKSDDEIIVTNLEYLSCQVALDYVVERAGAKAVEVSLPFPIGAETQVVEKLLSAVTPKTKLVLLDHVTSATGIILPIERIQAELAARGVDLLVDGAHAPGMLDLNLEKLGVAYYTGNCHKWICSPKGSAFLYVREDKQSEISPLAIGHGSMRHDLNRPRLWHDFDWTGTHDPSAYLCIPAAIEFFSEVLPGGWSAVRQRNNQLVLEARQLLTKRLGMPAPAPDTMIGSLAALVLPAVPNSGPSDPLQLRLAQEYSIEAMISFVARPKIRMIRLSAQLYNSIEQYSYLCDAVEQIGTCG